MSQVSEADWKVLRDLRPVALERFCQGVMAEVERISTDQTQSNHQRYMAIYQLMRDRDKDLANIFDDVRRSNALICIAHLLDKELLIVSESARFSDELQVRIKMLLS